MAPSSEGEGEGGTSKAGNDHSLAVKAESSRQEVDQGVINKSQSGQRKSWAL